jgi:AraC-like DNA-binding protein
MNSAVLGGRGIVGRQNEQSGRADSLNPYQLFIDSLQIRFLHLQEYPLDYRWRIHEKTMEHSVLWMIEEGSIIMELDGARYACQAGQACIIPDRSILSSWAVTSRVVIASINFDAEIPILSKQGWTRALHLPVVFDCASGKAREALGEMREYGNASSPFNSLIKEAGLLRSMYVLLHSSKPEPAKLDYDGMDLRIHTVIDFLLCHQDHMPDVAELAGLVELSESHLRKLFIQHTGLAPLHFVHRLKLEQAKKRLISTNQTIAQIATELGIQNINYFSRLFKAKLGLTPQQYRHQFRM